ncbi:MAG TPA: fibronectin type III domain-containing protein [Bacteroidales bacterium]|nr:fibronectin type III domain-containing protein [Bacteroidales bacterium]
MRRIVIILIALLGTLVVKAQDNIFNIIFKQDFENDTPGLYDYNEWKQDWNSPAYSNGLDRTYIVKTDAGSKVLQWNYPKGCVGSSSGGGQFEPENNAGADEIYMSYNIKFRPGFDWVLGGKLPGLKGGPDHYNPGGPTPAWGDGFSNGLMWGHGYGGQDDVGGLYFYTYYQDMPSVYGESRRWGKFKFDTNSDHWYNVTIRMVMNTVKSDGSGGNHDGIMEGFIDGKLVASYTGLRFRNVSSIHIDKMKVYSFFGGSGSQYGAARDEWTLIDDVYLFTYADGVNVPRGNNPSPSGRILQLPNLTDNSSVNTPDISSPSVPTGLTLDSKNTSSITFSWSKSSDNTGVAGYNIWVNGGKNGTTSNTNFQLTGLKDGTSYKIAVSAFDAASNESEKSNSLDVTTDNSSVPDTDAPSKPSGLVVTGKSASSVNLSWSPSSDNTGVAGYIVFVDGTAKGTSNTTSYVINDLNPGTTFVLTVSSFDASSNKSALSQPLSVTTESAGYSDNNAPENEIGLPNINIIEVHNEAENSAKTVSEISSYGNSELYNFGLMISRDGNPVLGGTILTAETEMYYVKNDDRVTKNLQAMYNFSEGKGNRVYDISGSSNTADLTIDNTSQTTWLSGQGLKVTGNTVISSEENSANLSRALSSTNEITMEAWIKPSDIEQSGPARILTLSSDNYNRAATLGQTGDATGYDYNVRLNTTMTDGNGLPEGSSNDSYQIPALQHLVYTRDRDGNEKIFVNGVVRYSGTRNGDFSSWTDGYILALANELTGNRPWRGTYYLVAVYNRALNNNEVVQNYKAGYGKLQFNSVLENLEPDSHYYLTAFAETDKGMKYGEIVDFVTSPVTVDEDSIQMNVYPNPSDGIFRVSFQYNKIDHATIRVSDMNGKLIHSSVIPVNDFGMIQEKQFNLSSKIKNGVYFVTLILGPSINTRKLIIQH